MAMTKKDYKLIANAIAGAKLGYKLGWPHTDQEDHAAMHALRLVEFNITADLARECPGFNIETFRSACTPKEG